jgi:hypothetical protein
MQRKLCHCLHIQDKNRNYWHVRAYVFSHVLNALWMVENKTDFFTANCGTFVQMTNLQYKIQYKRLLFSISKNLDISVISYPFYRSEVKYLTVLKTSTYFKSLRQNMRLTTVPSEAFFFVSGHTLVQFSWHYSAHSMQVDKRGMTVLRMNRSYAKTVLV